MRAFQQCRALEYKVKTQRIPPNLAGNKYNMRRPGMEGHLLFNKAVTKRTRKRPKPGTLKDALMSTKDNRDVKEDLHSPLSSQRY